MGFVFFRFTRPFPEGQDETDVKVALDTEGRQREREREATKTDAREAEGKGLFEVYSLVSKVHLGPLALLAWCISVLSSET